MTCAEQDLATCHSCLRVFFAEEAPLNDPAVSLCELCFSTYSAEKRLEEHDLFLEPTHTQPQSQPASWTPTKNLLPSSVCCYCLMERGDVSVAACGCAYHFDCFLQLVAFQKEVPFSDTKCLTHNVRFSLRFLNGLGIHSNDSNTLDSFDTKLQDERFKENVVAQHGVVQNRFTRRSVLSEQEFCASTDGPFQTHPGCSPVQNQEIEQIVQTFCNSIGDPMQASTGSPPTLDQNLQQARWNSFCNDDAEDSCEWYVEKNDWIDMDGPSERAHSSDEPSNDNIDIDHAAVMVHSDELSHSGEQRLSISTSAWYVEESDWVDVNRPSENSSEEPPNKLIDAGDTGHLADISPLDGTYGEDRESLGANGVEDEPLSSEGLSAHAEHAEEHECLGTNSVEDEPEDEPLSLEGLSHTQAEQRLQMTSHFQENGIDETTCWLCSEALLPEDARGASCGHLFCRACLRKYASRFDLDNDQVMCPVANCRVELSSAMLLRLNLDSPCSFDEIPRQAIGPQASPPPELEGERFGLLHHEEPFADEVEESPQKERRLDPLLGGRLVTYREMIQEHLGRKSYWETLEPLHVEATIAILVEGAGGVGNSTNGIYTEWEVFEGRPLFKQVDGSAIIYFNENWKINFRGDTTGWYYQAPMDHEEHEEKYLPPVGKWTIDGYDNTNAEPAPSVFWKLEASIDDLYASYLYEEHATDGNASQAEGRTALGAVPAPVEQHFQCPICLDDNRHDNSIGLECGHRLCRDCFGKYLETKITDAQVAEADLVCPMMNCSEGIPVPSVQEALHGTPLWDKFLGFRADQWQPEDDDIMCVCPNRGCAERFLVPPDLSYADCPACRAEICMSCRKLRHDGLDCRDMLRSSTDSTFERFLSDFQMKRCPVCGVASERESGCNFMTCESRECRRGGKCTFWCYVCAQELREDEHYSHFPDGPFEDACYGRSFEQASPNQLREFTPLAPPPRPERAGRQHFLGGPAADDPLRPVRLAERRHRLPQFGREVVDQAGRELQPPLPEVPAADARRRAPRWLHPLLHR